MAIVIKQKEITNNVKADVYTKIDSIRAGMGEDGKITCYCTQWLETESRKNNEEPYKNNITYHIPDDNIFSDGGSLIQAVYKAFKKYFEDMGYVVEDDTNTYQQNNSNVDIGEITNEKMQEFLANTNQKEINGIGSPVTEESNYESI